jgi:Uncharacterized protein conserved in bacteria
MLPTYCPSCQTQLKVKKLMCEHCQTEVNGSYELPMLALLSPEDQKFILSFVKSSGSLKEMASQMNLSYPTVRNLLNDIIERIETREKTE